MLAALALLAGPIALAAGAAAPLPSQNRPAEFEPAASNALGAGDPDLEAQLDALIVELDPPSLGEILSWFEPLSLQDLETLFATDDPQWPCNRHFVGDDKLRHDALWESLTKRLDAGDFAEALPLAQRFLQMRERALGADHWKTRDAAQLVDVTARRAESPLKAHRLSEQLLELNRMTIQHNQAGRYREALRLAVEMFEIQKRAQDIYPDALSAQHNVGHLLHQSGHSRDGAKFLAATAAMEREYRTMDQPTFATSISELGLALQDAGDLQIADALAHQVVAMRLKLLGRNHIDTAQSFNKLGVVRSHLGDYTGAIHSLQRAIEICRALNNDSDGTLDGFLNNLAVTMGRHGNYAEAEPIYNEILQRARQNSGDRHPYVGQYVCNLASLAEQTGDVARAERLFREGLAIFESVLPDGHPLIARANLGLANVVAMRRDFAGAEALYRKALSALRASLGDESPRIADISDQLARMLRVQGRYDEALSLGRESLALRQRVLGSAHPSLVVPSGRLAFFLVESDREANLDEAKALMDVSERAARSNGSAPRLEFCAQYAEFLRFCRASPVEIIPFFDEAIRLIEARRTNVAGGELERSRYFGRLSHWNAYHGMIRTQVASTKLPSHGQSESATRGVSTAYDYLERGRGRALLDLMDRGKHDLYYILAARADREKNIKLDQSIHALRLREANARKGRLASERKIELARYAAGSDEQERVERVAALSERREQAQDEERQATRRLFELALRELAPQSLRPLGARQVAAELDATELLLAYDIGPYDSMLLVLFPDGLVTAHRLKWPNGAEISAMTLATTIERFVGESSGAKNERDRSLDSDEPHPTAELYNALIPGELQDQLVKTSRVLLVSDGPLHQLPFETLIVDAVGGRRWADVGPPIVYGPSGTILAVKRQWAARQREENRRQERTALIALGDPIFALRQSSKDNKLVEQAPGHGVLLVMVQPESNASGSGLRAGDVLLDYNGVHLKTPADLGPAIESAAALLHESRQVRNHPASVERGGSDSSEKTVPVRVWRSGKTVECRLAPGPMGVRPSQLTMVEALRVYHELQQSEEERSAALELANTRDGFGEALKPLPGTRTEVNALGEVMKRAGVGADDIKLLTGEDATLTRLFETTQSPRFLHLATHGKVESGRRVYESALALTVPVEPTPDDFGFLRLQDLLYKWGGKLEGTELVVLSGCATATGRLEAADGFVGLTWGFLFAGADSVIASLWKVDDAATVLLMTRLYENLLGVYDQPRWKFPAGTEMPKAEALHEAKRWLKSRTPKQNRDMLAELGFDLTGLDARYRAERGGRKPSQDPQPLADPFDYSHPRYWAAFILIGDPG